MTEHTVPCQWCGSNDITLSKSQVSVINAQVDFPHALYTCGACSRLSLSAQWGTRQYTYRALESRRFLRSSLYIVIYDIACAWCGRDEQVEPEEINATIGNPASTRYHYDIYRCSACNRSTAVSYLGEVLTYPATRDSTYHQLYYLHVGDE